ncbi:MAG: methyltransferase domain-containing protein [Caldilineales bacterium]|nr:methyltransferase domain-containing protein [Caldilineales bacterium]MCW5857431.1 methyltransferase domain-containing protein [Caldilineales bacterium]
MPNPWTNPDLLPPDEARSLARFIAARAEIPDQRQAYAALLETLAPQPGERLLDMGCGAGNLARRLAEQVGESGEVVGADISQAMLEVAREGSALPHLRYEQTDGLALPFPAGYFDGAILARTLMHAQHPHEILVELRRVVRPGGRLAILEADWGTCTVDHSNRALSRRIIDWRTDAIDGDNWMGRQLVGRCLEAGWEIGAVSILATIGRNASTTHFGSLRRCADLAIQHRIITQAEYDAWVGELDERLAAGRFFATINETIVLARKPEFI